MSDLRENEVAVDAPAPTDAGLVFIGRIATPWQQRGDCPRQGSPEGPLCRVTVFPPWNAALDGLAPGDTLDILYWLHESRRDLVRQSPSRDGRTRGTFSLRSPVRPNPIGVSQVMLEAREGDTLLVRGLDCLNGTPLLDIKPARCGFAGGRSA